MSLYDDFLFDDDSFVVVYTDGACFNNGRWNAAAGLGVVFNYEHSANYSGPVKGRASNNTGEIQAATWAIRAAYNMEIECLRIKTDSKFLINSVCKWMPSWKRNGWSRTNGAPLANRVDFQFLDRAIRSSGMVIEFEYIEAHSGDPFNELADELAKDGANEYSERYNYV